MKQWRPDDWDNPFHKTGDFGYGKESWNEQPEFSAFEAGVDAILNALKKRGVWLNSGQTLCDAGSFPVIPYKSKGGYLIFIEEAKDE